MDFTMKNYVDPASIASLYQRKAMAEQEAARQAKQQEIDNVFRAVPLITGAIDDAIKVSKDRQARDVVNALSSLASTFRPAGAPEVGPLTEPHTQQQQALGLATKIAPDKMAEKLINNQFPKETNPGSRYQQSAIETVGPDGAPQTVFVTFDTQTGQQINPQTGQPITASSDTKGLPKKGYAQSYRNAGFTKDGKEVVANARTGEKFTLEEGKPVPYTDKIYPKLENVPTGMTDAVAELKYSQTVLDRITQSFDPDYVGPVAARAGKVSKFVDALTEEQRIEFYGNVAEYKNSIIKAITGAQMSEVEAKRIIQQIPDDNASPRAFLAGLKRASIATNQRIAAKQRAMKDAGYVSRGEPINDEELNKAIDEKFGTLMKNLPTTGQDTSSLPSQVKDAVEKLKGSGVKIKGIKRIK